MMKARKMPAFSYARQNECSIMKIVLIENCVGHSANFIIYKGDGDLTVFLLCVQMRSYRRKSLLKNLVLPIDTLAILKGEVPTVL